MERLNYIRDHVDNLIEKITVDPDKDLTFIRKNEYTHSYGVAQLCKVLAQKRGLDPEIAAIIGHLHDLGRILFNIIDDTHGPKGAEEANCLLKISKRFSDEEIALICTAIKNHGEKGVQGNPYEELIKDADITERFLWRPEQYKVYGGERLKKVMFELGLNLVY